MKLMEEYRGEKIYYDETNDKFVCDLVGANREVKRQSLAVVRKDIDRHFDVNKEFKPFKCWHRRCGTPTLIWIKSIRLDGDVMASKNEDLTDAYRISSYDFKDLLEDSEDMQLVVSELLQKEKEEENFVKKIREEKYALAERFVKLSPDKLK